MAYWHWKKPLVPSHGIKELGVNVEQKQHTTERAHKFNLGDIVKIDFSGEGTYTTHRVVAVRDGVCQSGVMYRVSPPVPKAGGPMSWLDEVWFTLVRKHTP